MIELHIFPLRVYFEDTDAGGIVYYANYMKFAERARTEMLRSVGIESGRLMREDNITLTVKTCHVDYQKPAYLDDTLEVHSNIIKVGGASLHRPDCTKPPRQESGWPVMSTRPSPRMPPQRHRVRVPFSAIADQARKQPAGQRQNNSVRCEDQAQCDGPAHHIHSLHGNRSNRSTGRADSPPSVLALAVPGNARSAPNRSPDGGT